MDVKDPLEHLLRGTEEKMTGVDRHDPCADRHHHADRHNQGGNRQPQEIQEFDPLGELNVEDAREVEQNELPEGLRFEYLGKKKTYPVIVNNALTREETETARCA